jgi:hypothetical protein
MDDRCHEAWRAIGGFLDRGAGGAKDEGAKKGSESAQVALGRASQSASDANSTGLMIEVHRSPAC